MLKYFSKFVFVSSILFVAAPVFAMGKHAPHQDPAPVAAPAPIAAPAPVVAPAPEQGSNGSGIFDSIKNGTSNLTPYELLKSLWDSGTPTKISDFPTYEQCASQGDKFVPTKSLSTWVKSDSKKEDLQIAAGWTYVVKNVKGMVSPAVPAKDNGPLFPISPAIPEKDAYFPSILVIASYGSDGRCNDSLSSDDIKYFSDKNYSLIDTADGAVETLTENSVQEINTYHSSNGVTVIKGIVTTKDAQGKVTIQEAYNYMWQQK